MDKIVLMGGHPRMGELLQIIDSGIAWSCHVIYRIDDVPGAGAVARRTDPRLKEASPREAIDRADRIVAVGPLSEPLRALVTQSRVEALPEPIDLEHCSKPVLMLAYNEEWLPDVLQALTHLSRKGYTFGVTADSPLLAPLLRLLTWRDDPDFVIVLEASDVQKVDYDAISDQLTHFAREVVAPEAHLRRLRRWYDAMKLGRNLYPLGGDSFYLSLERQTRVLSKAQCKLLMWLDGRRPLIPYIDRFTVEETAYMLLHEDWMDRRLTSCLDTGLARIDNMNQVILSFPGSHRCNLRCEYCFSDHSCAQPSRMTEGQVISICDMLAWDHPDIEIHFDNGLSGEPLLDFDQVMRRHNTTIAYHRTTGTPASFGLLTNGTLLDDAHLLWLKRHIPYVGFSLDGDEKTNDAIRHGSDGKPTYAGTIRGIRRLRKANWPVETGVSMVISKRNLDIQSLETHMMDTLDIHNVVAKPVRASSDSDFALNIDDIDQLLRNYEAMFRWVNDEAGKGNLKPLYTILQPLDYAGRFLLRCFWNDRLIVKRCGCGEIIFSTADDGRVYPCDSFNGVEDHELGNLEEGMHRRGDFRVPFVHREMRELGCGQCPLRYLCGGVCAYVKHINGQKYNDVIRMECALAMGLARLSLTFWQHAAQTWKPEVLEEIARHVRHIGFTPLKDGALVYAPC